MKMKLVRTTDICKTDYSSSNFQIINLYIITPSIDVDAADKHHCLTFCDKPCRRQNEKSKNQQTLSTND